MVLDVAGIYPSLWQYESLSVVEGGVRGKGRTGSGSASLIVVVNLCYSVQEDVC